jgi:hypothetical protein
VSETQRRLVELERAQRALQAYWEATKTPAAAGQRIAGQNEGGRTRLKSRVTRRPGHGAVEVSKPRSALDPSDPMNPTLGD